MRQKFTKSQINSFKKYFDIKENPGKIEQNLLYKATKYCKFLKKIPGIQMVAVGNSVALNYAKSSSDIDLFIITKPNRIWTVRFFVTLVFQILGLRKTSTKHSGRFCLSFFITTNSLNFEKIAIENDIYLYFRIIYLKPILDYNNTFDKFILENKKWCDFSDFEDKIAENKKYIKYSKKTSQKNSIFGNLFEKIIRAIWKPKTLKSHEKKGFPFGEIISDDILKFHTNDIRKEVSEKIV